MVERLISDIGGLPEGEVPAARELGIEVTEAELMVIENTPDCHNLIAALPGPNSNRNASA